MPKKSAAPPSKPGELHFVQIHQPTDGSWRRIVRSHTARRHYAEARQRFVPQQKEPGVNDIRPRQTPAAGRPNPQTDAVDGRRDLHSGYDGNRSIPDDRVVPEPRMPLKIRSIDPFDSLARPTTRFESHLLDHYVQFVTVKSDLCPGMSSRLCVEPGTGLWSIQTAVGDQGLLNGILLSACRSLAVLQRSTMYADLALEYKGACIRSVNDAISQRGQTPSSVTLAAVVALAQDSCLAEDVVAARQHCKAAEMIVQMKGGPRAIQGTDLMKSLVQWATFETELQKNSDFRKELWGVLEGYLDEM